MAYFYRPEIYDDDDEADVVTDDHDDQRNGLSEREYDSEPSENGDEDDPPWTRSVGERGDVFYLQAEESVQYVQSTAADQHGSTNGHMPINTSAERSGRGKKGARKKGKTKKQDMENNLNHVNGSKVTFNDVPTGVTRDVTLYVDPHRHNFGRRASQCESLFGIIPGYFHTPSQETYSKDKRIMVQGLFPGGEALRHGVKIGEWLMAVNDLEVDFSNIDTILSAISSPRHVKLTLQKIAIQTSPRHTLLRKASVDSSLVRLISGERLHEEAASLTGVPHCVMYLTTELGHSDCLKDKEDVLYLFPKAGSKLVDVRGMFTTLCHMLHDVTNNTAESSTLLYDDQLVHVGYRMENKEIMVLAVPANKLSLVQLRHLCDDVVRLLKVLFGSLHRAFCDPRTHPRLDHLFSLTFQQTLLGEEMLRRGTKQTAYLEPLLGVVPGVRALTMPEETKVTMNNCLSELESADFADMADDYYGLRRSYVILGSALFYKGYLLASHLSPSDLLDVSVYLRTHCLLTLCAEEQLGQLVVWREVYPTRRADQGDDRHRGGYTEPQGRWFLLVVGMRNAVLSVLLEAGGCAAPAEGHPTPDPFYVDQARATVLQLDALDVFNQCEIRLQGPAMPSLACPDWFLPPTKGSRGDDSGGAKIQSSPKMVTVTPSKKVTQPESILKKRSTPSPQVDHQRHGRGALYDIESDLDSISTGTSEGSTPNLDRRGRKVSAGSDESGESLGSAGLFKGSRRKRNLLSVFDLSDLRRGLGDMNVDDQEAGSLVKITTGCDNTLFHYIHIDALEGILLCPTQQEMAQVSSPAHPRASSPLHSRVLDNFHNACLNIKAGFEHSNKLQTLSERGSQPKFGVDAGLSGTLEQGVLFTCAPDGVSDSKRAPPALTYWVVGRQIMDPYPCQFYVCFHDSAHQNLVEMAFKLGFGVGV